MITAVSLFAGVGGFDLALERAGVKVVASVEIDKHARSVLEKRFPNTKLFNDVKEVTGNDLRSAGFVPDRGILVGGFPCQDLSVAGKRAGLDGARSGLYWEIIRIIDETQVEWVLLENVPGLLSSQRGADMGAVIGALADRGYRVGWRVLDAQYFGVPQRRRRVFIVARRTGTAESIGKVLFERESLRGNSPQGEQTGQEITGSVGQSVESAISLYEPHHGDGRETVDRANTLNARMGTGGNNLPVLIDPLAYPIREDAKADTFSATPLEVTNALQAHQPSVQSHHAQTFVVEPEKSSVLYGQTGFAKYTEGAATLTATTYKRPKDNVVCEITPSAE